MKLCKDCKHVAGKSTCTHPSVFTETHLVTGERMVIGMRYDAEWQRSIPRVVAWVEGACGKQGRYWEPKIDARKDPIGYLCSLNATQILLEPNKQ